MEPGTLISGILVKKEQEKRLLCSWVAAAAAPVSRRAGRLRVQSLGRETQVMFTDVLLWVELIVLGEAGRGYV